MEECSKKVNGECGHKLECIWCPENKKDKHHPEHDDDDADDFCE